MKIRLLSDIHLEFSHIKLEPAGEDIIVLAGDIGIHTQGVLFAKELAARIGVPVLVLAGNHEFYDHTFVRHTWDNTIEDCRREAHHTSVVKPGEVTFLEDQEVVYQDVRFIGATLWTNLRLFGEDPLVEFAVATLSDYRVIHKDEGEPICLLDTLHRHGNSIGFITDRLNDKFDGPTVVVTHHAPSWLSVVEPYKTDKASAGFASRLEDLILDTNPTLWCHGHMHTAFDYTLSDTRIVCNPRGYDGYEVVDNFDPNLILEI